MAKCEGIGGYLHVEQWELSVMLLVIGMDCSCYPTTRPRRSLHCCMVMNSFVCYCPAIAKQELWLALFEPITLVLGECKKKKRRRKMTRKNLWQFVRLITSKTDSASDMLGNFKFNRKLQCSQCE